jgi:hypothetical protein
MAQITYMCHTVCMYGAAQQKLIWKGYLQCKKSSVLHREHKSNEILSTRINKTQDNNSIQLFNMLTQQLQRANYRVSTSAQYKC